MKTITAFTVLVIIASFLSPTPPVFGQSPEAPRRFSISAAPLLGMIYGQSEEIVYSETSRKPYKAPKMSQLLWDMKPLWYYGVRVGFAYQVADWGLFSDLEIKAGIPALTGRMEDRDWLSVRNSDLTHFSVHDNETKELWRFAGALGVFVPIQSRYRFKVSANVSFTHISFTGKNGYGIYARENPAGSGVYDSIETNPDRIPFSGEVIKYSQDWVVVAPALSLEASLFGPFSGELSLEISPLVWCTDLDEHLTTRVQYRDNTRWGLLVEPRGKLAFNPSERLELSMEAGYRFISGTRGESYAAGMGSDDFKFAGEAGTGLSVLDAGLSCKVRF